MSKGVVYFVKNNEQLNYAKQANISAMLVKHYLNLPVTVFCSQNEELLLDPRFIDNIILLDDFLGNTRSAYDQGLNRVIYTYYNQNRTSVIDNSPYDQTLLLDTDYLVQNSQLLEIFKTDYDLCANNYSKQANGQSESLEEKRINPAGPCMYWATALYFTKSQFTKDVFSLMDYIKNNWEYYKRIYNIPRPLYRNDYAFTIAVHIMFDGESKILPSLPTAQVNSYVPDRIMEVQKGSLLVNNGFTPFRISRRNLHFMNKWNLESNYTDFERAYCEGF